MALPRPRTRPGGYVNPLSGAHVTPERIDMGVDYAGSGPVRAIGDALITGIANLSNTAWGGWWIQYKLLGGPYAGRTVYVAEGVRPLVRERQTVPAGTPIASIIPGSSTGIETGFGSGEIGSTYAQQHGGYVEGWRTAAGNAMSNLIAVLGGPAGLVGGRPTHGSFQEASGTGWAPCTLTWYDPALGGTNSASGKADPHSATSSGEAYNPAAFTCAAPGRFAFGTMLTFRYRNRTVTCKVNDRGGAISDVHFDLSRAAAARLGIINAGKVHAEYSQGAGITTPPASGVTRPGGATADDSGKGLEDMYRAFLTEGVTTDSALADFTKNKKQGQGQKLPGHGPKAAGMSILPGLGPVPDIPGLPNFDPLDWFHQATDAIKTTQDLLKLIGWIFNPRNMLRAVEFVAGMSLIYVAVRINLHIFADAASEKSARIFGKRRGRGKRGRQGRSGKGGGRTRELAYESGRRRIAARSGPGEKPKPNATKQLGTGAAGKGKLASAASKTKTVLKLVPK